MKKIRFIALIGAAVFLVACGRNDASEQTNDAPDYAYTTQPHEQQQTCQLCFDHYVGQELRNPTPPLNLREGYEVGDGFLESFARVHEAYYFQFELDGWEGNRLYFWADEPLRDVRFVSLAFDYEEGNYMQARFFVHNVIISLDSLQPNEAVALNIAFAHYLFPHGGVIFTDQSGSEQRMFLLESMQGGCYPSFLLAVYETNEWQVWN